jgi:hypothetical protein
MHRSAPEVWGWWSPRRNRAAVPAVIAIALALQWTTRFIGAQSRGGTPAPAAAHPVAPPMPAGRIVGRLVTPSGDSARGVAGGVVVLHRISATSAGPLDSVRSDARGQFVLRAPAPQNELTFALSSVHDGMAYITPLGDAVSLRQGDADVMVYDTTTQPIPIDVLARHIIIFAPDASTDRRIADVHELGNAASRTRLPAPGASGAVWTTQLPSAAREFAVDPGDVPASAVRRVGDRVEVSTPFAPGVKQLVYSYSLAATAFPLRLSVGHPAPVVEVLVEEPGLQLSGLGVSEVSPVAAKGRVFRRFLGQNLVGTEIIEIRAPAPKAAPERRIIATIVAIALLVMIGALGVALRRPRSTQPAVRG